MQRNYAIIIAIISGLLYLISRKYIRRKMLHYITKNFLIRYKPISPENTILTFDFHDVIVNYDYPNIISTFLKSNKKLRLFIALLNPFVLWDIIKMKYNKGVSEQFIVSIGRNHKSLEPYIPLGIKIANTQKVNPKMLELIKELKGMGYQMHIFSNIGAIIFQDAKDKFAQVFENFDKIILPSEQNGYIRKPYQNAFKNYLDSIDSTNKQIIFVDDKLENIQTAERNALIGIKFKNYEQLKREFIDLGVIKK